MESVWHPPCIPPVDGPFCKSIRGIEENMMGRKLWRGEKGQALAEMAIILPVLLVLLVGMIEFGLLLFNQQVITNASREGARYGIVSRSPRYPLDSIKAVVDNYCADHMISFGSGPPPETIAPTLAGPHAPVADAQFQDTLTVIVTFDYDFLVLPNFIGDLAGGITLRAETTMLYE